MALRTITKNRFHRHRPTVIVESNYRDVIIRGRRYCLGSSKLRFHSNESLIKSALQNCYSYLTIRTAVKKVVRLIVCTARSCYSTR